LILNGSFELPAIPANSYENTTPPTYWSLSGGQFAFLDNGNVTGVLQPGATWPLPEDGQQFVDIGNEPTFSLSQDFTVTNPGIYTLSWYDNTGQIGGLQGSPYTATVINTGTVQTVTSTNLDGWNATSAWTPRSIQLSLSSATYALEFQSDNYPSGLDTLIDNVSLVQLGIHQAAAQCAFFRIVGPTATTITAFNPNGTMVWSNAQPGETYTIQTVASLPGGTNWVNYVQILAINGVNTNLLVDFTPPSGMALIPAGSFAMGDTLDGERDAAPIVVTVSAFYMDVNLVNYSRWQSIYTNGHK